MSLAKFPDQRRWLAANPDQWQNALEELLRYESPVQGLARATTRDVTLHDVTIPEGDQVLLLYGSANHDEAVFPEGDGLDVCRPDVSAPGCWDPNVTRSRTTRQACSRPRASRNPASDGPVVSSTAGGPPAAIQAASRRAAG